MSTVVNVGDLIRVTGLVLEPNEVIQPDDEMLTAVGLVWEVIDVNPLSIYPVKVQFYNTDLLLKLEEIELVYTK